MSKRDTKTPNRKATLGDASPELASLKLALTKGSAKAQASSTPNELSTELTEKVKSGAINRAGRNRKQKQQKKTKVKAAGRTELYRRSEAEIEAPPPPPPPPSPYELRQRAYQNVLAVVASSTPAVEERPDSISEESRDFIDRALQAGQAIWSSNPQPDEDGYVAGLDFGTSSMKMAFGQPYTADDPVGMVPVPEELRSFQHPGLWQTVVWYAPSRQTFSAYPAPEHIPLDGFKTSVVAGKEQDRMPSCADVSKYEAATAFLALQFTIAAGLAEIERPLGSFQSDRYWLFNIGIPVAYRDDAATFERYKKMVRAAYRLGIAATRITLTDVKRELAEAPGELPAGFAIVPELVAAIVGYCARPPRPLGAHVLIDVGASTLDLVTFNIQKPNEKLPIFTSGVELLGASTLDVARGAGIADTEFGRACELLYERVVRRAMKIRAPDLFLPSSRRRDVQLVATGGGCMTTVHTGFVEAMLKPSELGSLPIARPAAPEKILPLECDLTRLLVAYGLTRDGPEYPEPKLPSQVDNPWRPPVRLEHFIDKDQI